MHTESPHSSDSEENRDDRAVLTYTPGEQLADRCIHYIGVAGGVAGSGVIIVAAAKSGSVLGVASVAIYSVAMVSMLGASILYNMADPSRRKELLRRFDHAAIFLMIAGTYTPLALIRIGGHWGVGVTLFVWLIAAIGIGLKIVFPRRLEGISIVLYLTLGWTVLVALRPLLDAVPLFDVLLLGIGCLLYSVGVLFHIWRSLPYHNAIWHKFVLGGAACQWVATFNGVVRA